MQDLFTAAQLRVGLSLLTVGGALLLAPGPAEACQFREQEPAWQFVDPQLQELPTNPVISIGGGEEPAPEVTVEDVQSGETWTLVPASDVPGVAFRPAEPLPAGRAFIARLSGSGNGGATLPFRTTESEDTDPPVISEFSVVASRRVSYGHQPGKQSLACDHRRTFVEPSVIVNERLALVRTEYFSGDFDGERIAELSGSRIVSSVPIEVVATYLEAQEPNHCNYTCLAEERTDKHICARFEFFDMAGNVAVEEACSGVEVPGAGGCAASGGTSRSHWLAVLLLLCVGVRRSRRE